MRSGADVDPKDEVSDDTSITVYAVMEYDMLVMMMHNSVGLVRPL